MGEVCGELKPRISIVGALTADFIFVLFLNFSCFFRLLFLLFLKMLYLCRIFRSGAVLSSVS